MTISELRDRGSKPQTSCIFQLKSARKQITYINYLVYEVAHENISKLGYIHQNVEGFEVELPAGLATRPLRKPRQKSLLSDDAA
jgi:hypothetical protein